MAEEEERCPNSLLMVTWPGPTPAAGRRAVPPGDSSLPSVLFAWIDWSQVKNTNLANQALRKSQDGPSRCCSVITAVSVLVTPGVAPITLGLPCPPHPQCPLFS